ncbi:MAG: hypothetical protein WCJ14_12110 [Verrucomicrobiota bacterium]
MKLRPFVCGSSVILAGWLALTFVVHVPPSHYQKPDAAPVTAVTRHQAPVVAAAAHTPAAAVFSISASR